MNVAVASLSEWRSEHEKQCSRRWSTAIKLLITNLLAIIGTLLLLLYYTPHH